MLLRSQIDMAELQRIVWSVGKRYQGNLKHDARFERIGRDGALVIRFTLAVHDSRAKGARRSAAGRHMPKASWQAHRDVMRAIFRSDPEAKLQTALATYDGRADFERSFEATGDKVVQSCGQRRTMRQLAV